MADITRADLYALGLRAAALSTIATGDQDTELEASSGTCRAYLRARYQGAELVAAALDPAYKGAVAKVCTHRLLSTRGYDPSRGHDQVAQDNHDAALRFLRDVAKGTAHLDVTEAEGSDFSSQLAGPGEVLSNPARGW